MLRAVSGRGGSSRRRSTLAAVPSVQSVEENEIPVRPGALADGSDIESDDAALVKRILSGDEHAFELLMRRHNQTLFRAARGIMHDATDAEDVVQEAYVKAFRSLRNFEGRSSLATWLVRIVINEARTRVRRQSRTVSLESAPMVDGDLPEDASLEATGWLSTSRRGPEDAVGNAELGNALSRAVDRLPDSLRTVFVLRCVEGMNVAETAECLDLTEEVVRVRLHRARAVLRADIDKTLSEEARRLFSFGQERCDKLVARVLERLHAERV